jgi:hypothetical protein
MSTIENESPVKVLYKNWRDEIAWRQIIPQEIYFGSTDYHPGDQWLLKVWDCEKNAERIYSMKYITNWDYNIK